jgi:hypothetical protein
MSGQANLALDLGEQNLSTGWVTSPPIRKLKQSEIKMSAEWLHGGIGSFSSPTAPANFQNRVDLGLERAEVLGLQDNEIVYEVYAYIYSGKPVGMMSVDLGESKVRNMIYIDSLAGHPGARNVGDILIEFAVNLSEQRGWSGVVELTAEKGTPDFYESLGFKPNNGIWDVNSWTLCRLTPAGTQQWTNQSGHWRLANVWHCRTNTMVPVQGTQFRN